MFRTLRAIAICLAALVLLAFALFLVNQTAQIVELAERLDPRFGTAVLWLLVAGFAGLLITPAVLWLRLPPALSPPVTDSGPEFERHLTRLRRRLARHPGVEGPLETREEIESALARLGEEAEAMVRESAAAVFLSTAISQSGRLDAFLVLGAHFRLVWRMAHHYYQRPSLRDMLFLYANVGATAFLAGELEDIDVSEQVQPILSSVLGSAATAIPGFQTASTILVHSVLTGSANAFLTLRVGMIARGYCSSLVRQERRPLRRSASAQAARMLGAIVSRGARTLVKSVARASKDKLFGTTPEAEALLEEGDDLETSITGTPKSGWWSRFRRGTAG